MSNEITLDDLQKFSPFATHADLERIKAAGVTPGQLAAVTNARATGCGDQRHAPNFMALVEAYEQKHECRRTEALTAVARKFPESHQRYLQDINRRQN